MHLRFSCLLTANDSANEGGMSWTVHQCELQAVVFPTPLPHVLRQGNCEGAESQVQGNAALFGLRVLVEGRRGRGATQSSSQRRLSAVHMPQHAHVKVQSFGKTVPRSRLGICHIQGVCDYDYDSEVISVDSVR